MEKAAGHPDQVLLYQDRLHTKICRTIYVLKEKYGQLLVKTITRW